MPRWTATHPAYFSFNERDDFDDHWDRINASAIRNSMSRAELYRHLFLLGLEQDELLHANENNVSSLENAMIRHRALLRKRRKTFEQMHELSKEMGRDNFISWYMDQDDCDMELLNTFIEEQTEYYATLPWNEHAKIWLHNKLGDGNSHATQDMRQAALAEGVIDESVGDWNKLKQLAWRLGLTSETDYGYWKWPEKMD